ncbi:MAG: hypothetical protein K6L75_11025 [Cellvibrionaceae bacterium]
MITVRIESVHKDPEQVTLKKLHEIYLNIEGKVVVLVNSCAYFDESLPIVEFAVALNDWIKKPVGTSFKYESMDEEDLDIFDITEISKGMYKLESSWQKNKCDQAVPREYIEQFVKNYITQVRGILDEKYNINLGERVGL